MAKFKAQSRKMPPSIDTVPRPDGPLRPIEKLDLDTWTAASRLLAVIKFLVGGCLLSFLVQVGPRRNKDTVFTNEFLALPLPGGG